MIESLPDAASLEPCVFVHDSAAGGEVVHVFGDLDIPFDRAFEAALERAIRPGRLLVADFTYCAYLGAAALSVLIRVRTRLGDTLRIAAPVPSAAARLLAIADMQQSFTIANSLETALGSLRIVR